MYPQHNNIDSTCDAVRDNTGVDGSCTSVARPVISCKLCICCPSTLTYWKVGGADHMHTNKARSMTHSKGQHRISIEAPYDPG